ncbi:MAG: hypothetical protein ACREIG_04890, partial [Nitrospiraceae bacterium]
VEVDAMDRLFVVIALGTAHRELAGRHQHHRRPVLAGERGWQGGASARLRGGAPVGRRARLLGRLAGGGLRVRRDRLRGPGEAGA